jgi:predicted enzyme related to lactoylglutathione lyase
MIDNLRLVTVWSEDLNNLLPFYRDTLGLKVGIEAEGFVAFGDLETPSMALGTHSEVHGSNSDPARHMVGFGTDDLNAEYDRLKAKGVEFIEAPSDNPGQGPATATLKDPEGNLVQLFQF